MKLNLVSAISIIVFVLIPTLIVDLFLKNLKFGLFMEIYGMSYHVFFISYFFGKDKFANSFFGFGQKQQIKLKNLKLVSD
jgi:hypothetical protein